MPEFKHFLLQGTASSEPYTAIGRGGSSESPKPPDRTRHGNRLLKQLAAAEKQASESLKLTPPAQGLQFVPLEFVENSVFGMQLDRLESEKKGIRVLNVKSKNDKRHFLVAVPNAEVEYFAKRFREYLTKDNIYGSPKNEPLASGIEEIVVGELADYWTDVDPTLPNAEERLWWDV